MATIFQCDICGNADVGQQENFVGLIKDEFVFDPRAMKNRGCRAHFCGDCYMKLKLAFYKMGKRIIGDEDDNSDSE